MQLVDLTDKHDGQTIYVLGSGASLNFLDPQFFRDKITVSTNYSARIFGYYPDYAFSHYHANAASLVSDTGTVVTVEKDTATGSVWSGEKPPNLVIAQTPYDKPPGSSWNPLTTHTPGTGQITYGSSSLHGAMHLAGHLGASFIVLVGADCGTIDGDHRVAGYPHGDKLWALYNRHHKLMKEYLEDNYPLKVYSLNPFINFNLEGHKFQGVE